MPVLILPSTPSRSRERLDDVLLLVQLGHLKRRLPVGIECFAVSARLQQDSDRYSLSVPTEVDVRNVRGCLKV